MSTVTLGLDVGGSKLLACLVDDRGQILAQRTWPTGRATGPDRVLDLVRHSLKGLPVDRFRPEGIGLGFPGLVDHRRGMVLSSVMLDGWHGFPLASELETLSGLPCRIDNDLNAAALAELGEAERRPQSMVLVGIGTGIGGAVVLDGHLWRGVSGVAGEIGNTTIDWRGSPCWCGRRGCLNTVASGSAVEQRLGLAQGELAALSADLPPAELDLALREAGRALGVGLANAINLLNPEEVVLCGGLLETGDAFFAAAEEAARAEAFAEAAAACRFRRARRGYEAVAVGAAYLARSAD